MTMRTADSRIRAGARCGAAGVLGGLAGLHLVWGLGSHWPARTAGGLAGSVAGTDRVPGPAACFAMTGVLAAAAALGAGAGGAAAPARLARRALVAGFLGRGLTGLTGRTGLLVPWTPSARFVEQDRRYFGPLCLSIAAAVAVGNHPGRRRGES
jgi:hypothetical protein